MPLLACWPMPTVTALRAALWRVRRRLPMGSTLPQTCVRPGPRGALRAPPVVRARAPPVVRAHGVRGLLGLLARLVSQAGSPGHVRPCRAGHVQHTSTPPLYRPPQRRPRTLGPVAASAMRPMADRRVRSVCPQWTLWVRAWVRSLVPRRGRKPVLAICRPLLSQVEHQGSNPWISHNPPGRGFDPHLPHTVLPGQIA
jgi:hypothetical protein